MIFSDNYKEHERYSLVSGERLDDYSMFPWLYTSLVDPQYKPILGMGIKNSLNRLFEYEYPIPDVKPSHDEDKHLGIYSKDGDITSYTSIIMARYDQVRKYLKNFKVKTSTLESSMYDKVDELAISSATALVGVEQDLHGDVTGITIQGENYDVSSYDNLLLTKLVAYSYYVPNYVSGSITVRENGELSFYSGFSYPTFITQIPRDEFNSDPTQLAHPRNKKKFSNRELSGRHVTGYQKSGLITDEQIAIIDSLEAVWDTRKELRIQLEHVFKGTELVDLILHVVKYDCFAKTDEPKTWKLWFDADGNRIDYDC